MYYLIYKITNLINGKIYVGAHKTTNLNDDYLGSGKYLLAAQKKYGLQNFKKEILHIFDNPSDMYEKEKEIVNEEFISLDSNYNIRLGGYGGWDFINSDEEKRKLKNQKARKITNKKILEKYGVENSSQIPTVKEKLSISMKNRIENGFNPVQFLPSFKGKNHSDKAKLKISEKNSIKQSGEKNSQYGTYWITDGINSKKIKNNEQIPNGWKKGRITKK
jgi:hypothetical protein